MKRYLLLLIFAIAAMTVVACGSSETTNEDSSDHHSDMHHDEGDKDNGHHGDDHGDQERVANNGRTITIISPEENATYTAGEEVEIRVEFENVDMEDGTHWHYYLDDSTSGTMMMDSVDDRIRELAIGEHTITTYLAGSDHIELEDGDKVTFTITE